MYNKEFWYDVMRSGAILGVIMAASRIVERYLLFYSDMELATASFLYLGESILACVVFIWLLVRFSRRRALQSDSRLGFSYGMALSYIILVSMFTGIIVGVGDTLFTSLMGYDGYVAGTISRLYEVKSLYAGMGINGSELKIFDDVVHAVRTATQPTMLQSVFSSFSNYILYGALPGFIIAASVKRNPEIGDMEF